MPASGMRLVLFAIFLFTYVHKMCSALPVRLHALLGDDMKIENELLEIFRTNEYSTDALQIPVRYNQGNWEYLRYTNTHWEVERDNNRLSEIKNKISEAEKVILEFHSDGKLNNNDQFADGKTADELSRITKELFPKRGTSKYSIRVVFPESCTVTQKGFQFINNFVKKMPSKEYNVKIGLTKIDVYPVFGKSNIPRTDRQIQTDRTAFYLQHRDGGWKFVHYKNGIWEEIREQKEHRELMAEAEKVVMVLGYDAQPDRKTKFKMEGKNPEELAAMFDSFFPQAENPHQRVRVRFPSKVTNIPDGQKFSSDFIKKLKDRQSSLDIYGLEPRVKVHIMFDNDRLFLGDLNDKFHHRKLYKSKRNLAAQYKYSKWHFLKYENNGLKTISNKKENDIMKDIILDAVELEIQINAHGSLRKATFEVASQGPERLADKLGMLMTGRNGMKAKAERIQLTFQCCNVGSRQGQEFVKDLTEQLKLVWGLNVKESISYIGWTKQENVMSVWIPDEIEHNAQEVLDGKFTIQDRHSWKKRHGKYISTDNLKRRRMVKTYRDSSDNLISERIAPFYEHESEVRKRIKMDLNSQSQHEIIRNTNINLPNDQDYVKQEIENNVNNNFCRRQGRSLGECSANDLLEKEYHIQEDSIKQVDGEIRFKLLHKFHPGLEREVTVPIDNSKLYYTASMEEFAHYYTEESHGMGLEGVGHGLAVYGTVMGFVGAQRYFAEGDIARGTISLSQSIHSIGLLSGANKVISKLSTRYAQMVIRKSAIKLGAEEALAKVTSAAGRALDSTAGKFLRAVPAVGLAFDLYMIEEDIRDIVHTNFSNPSDMQYLPLKSIDLVLDVGVAALSLAEAVAPPFAVIITPLIIAITCVRLAIGDIYTDILGELNSLKKDASGWEKFEAFVIGFDEGLADAATGGLFRNMKSLENKYEQNLALLRNLSHVAHYFKLEGQIIDFTVGDLSSYGGFITLRLEDDGFVKVQIGGVPDRHGGSKTISQTLYNPDIKDVILGLGESSQFLYKEEYACLWWIIPVEHKKIICGRAADEFSLFGTYYGNSQDNTFYTVQRPVPGKGPVEHKTQHTEEDCSVGMVQSDSEVFFSNYYYFIEAQSGQDTFFLGPQQSHVSGGDGNDIYIVPEDGGQVTIDNFSHDKKDDILKLYVPFDSIVCSRMANDLVLTYRDSHKIRVKNWFVSSNTAYFQHLSFWTKDGVGFVPEERTFNHMQYVTECSASSLDYSMYNQGIRVILKDDFPRVVQVLGSNFSDYIEGNDRDNVINGGSGQDTLMGGRGADTYVIHSGQGCDSIHNFADDNIIDMVVFDVEFSRIRVSTQGVDIRIFDTNDSITCLNMVGWLQSDEHKHATFVSSDHVQFSINEEASVNTLKVEPFLIDYSTENKGVKIDLSLNKSLHSILTVMDSPFNDSIVGNNIGNFLSCSGGTDYLQGKEGSDLYVIKSECQMVNINNNATDQKTDILFLPFAYSSLNLLFGSNRLTIASSESIYPTIHLLQWDAGDQWRHMLIKTADGITAHLPDNIIEWQTSSKPVAIEIVVTTNETCQISAITYNLNDEKWQNVIRFQGLSDVCSYTIKGNTLDNYIDPGPSHSQMLQTMEGGPGSDTYVMKYGYGLYNEINNFALDRKMDRLLLHILYNEITISLSPPSVTIRCNSKSSFLQVVLFNYLKGDEYRHLEIHSADGYVFTINLVDDPYKNVTEINLSLSQVSQKLLLAETKEFSALKSVHGSLLFPNLINSATDFIHIVGGTQDDILIASGNKQIIEGLGGHDEIIGGPDNDIILGGNGNDLISAGNGDDLIYPGNGMDIVDGGPGKDTLLFSGNASTGRGVYVDLSMGIGLYCDAEGDTYTNVEAVKGTEFDDVLIGDMADNELYGHFGDDTLITRDGGRDLLFGGPGNDTYVLDFNSGTVIIQNFALDLALDTVLINSAAWEDTCFFLMEGFLHVKVRHFDPLLVLSGQDQLLIVIENYQRNTTCRHIQFLFANETQIGENEFENAVNVQEIIDYFNSTNVDLIFNSLNETSLNITFTSNNQPSSFTNLYNSMLVLANENKDVDISSNINPGEPRLLTNLQSGVLYTISINVLKCGVPIAASPSLLVRTKPQPPLNLTIVAISFDSIELTWSHPQSDTNPNWEHYKYTVKVNGLNKWYTIEVGTNITETRIANLEWNTTYGIAIMSTIDGINSMFSDMIHTRTEYKCEIAVANGFIENIKMTAVGPVALIACNYGYVLRQPHEVLCPTEAVEIYSCDPSSCSDGSSFIKHGTSRDKVCFGIKITSRCYFGKWSPPIPFCCEDIPFLSGGLTHFILDSNNNFQVKYSCLHGYALSGPFQRLCAAHERSHWIPQLEIATKCNPISCPSLPHVPNGLYQTKGMTRYPLQPHYGVKFLQNDVVFLKCNTYYHSSIDQEIRCDNGNWIGEWGTCLPNVRLNSIEKNNFSLKANIEVFLNGFWHASICVEPKTFCQGSIFLSQTDFENLGKIACRSEGMELNISRQTHQPSTVTCHQLRLINTATAYEGQVEYYHEETSRWESACFPRMLANIICRILGMAEASWTSSVRDAPGNYNSQIWITCSDSTCSVQKLHQQCSYILTCRQQCAPISVPNGSPHCEGYFEGDTCRPSCPLGYILKGPSLLHCVNTDWIGQSALSPYCLISEECGNDDVPGPHSLTCLIRLWQAAGCSTKSNWSPTHDQNMVNHLNSMTVGNARQYLATLPAHRESTLFVDVWNPLCEVEEKEKEKCFPGDTTVFTPDGTVKAMSELNLGDHVLAIDSSGQLVYSEVILWLDRQTHVSESYVLLELGGEGEVGTGSRQLFVTGDHVLFIASANFSTPSARQRVSVLAKDVRPGHLLYTLCHDGTLKPFPVRRVGCSVRQGAYAPLTKEGTLLVNGIVASCYALNCNQPLAHLSFAPYRAFHTISTYLPQLVGGKQGASVQVGMHWYPLVMYRLGQWIRYPFGETCNAQELKDYHYGNI